MEELVSYTIAIVGGALFGAAVALAVYWLQYKMEKRKK